MGQLQGGEAAGARGKVEWRWVSLAWISPDDGVEPHFSNPRHQEVEEGMGSIGQGAWEGPLGTLAP